MTTETHPEATQDTTLTGPTEHMAESPRPKRKRTARRKSANTQRSDAGTPRAANTGGFSVPIGDSGEVVQSAWHFGG